MRLADAMDQSQAWSGSLLRNGRLFHPEGETCPRAVRKAPNPARCAGRASVADADAARMRASAHALG